MKQKIFLQVQEWEQKLASVKSNHDNANDKMKKMKEEIILITSECETMKANLTTKKNILRHAHVRCIYWCM